MDSIHYLKKYFSNNDLECALKRLENGEPVQYIVGEVDFYGVSLKVNNSVLIPRFETEELVFKTIKYLEKYFKNGAKVVDLGTGSGCIAIALKKKLPSIKVSAVDISKEATLVAKENAELNKVDIDFYLGNMLEPLNEKFDCIISNPPYISPDEEVMDLVKNNEPHLALYANNNGLECYQNILKNAKTYLNDKYLIAFEIGMTQASDIKKIAITYFPEAIITIEQDMQSRDRFVFITNIKSY